MKNEKRVETKERKEGAPTEVERQVERERKLSGFILRVLGTGATLDEKGAKELAARLLDWEILKHGRLADEVEVRQLLKERVNKSFNSFLKGESHRYTADVIRVNENDRDNRELDSPAILICDRGGFVRVYASEKIRKKLLGISTPSKHGGGWAILEDASKRAEEPKKDVDERTTASGAEG